MRPVAVSLPLRSLLFPVVLLASAVCVSCADDTVHAYGTPHEKGAALDGGDLDDASLDDASTDADDARPADSGPDSGGFRLTGGNFACSASPDVKTASALPWIALLAGALVRRRRRRIARGVGVATALAVTVGAHTAQADVGRTYALARFEPTPAGDVFFMSDAPAYAPGHAFLFRGGVVGDYGWRPFVIHPDGQIARAVIDHEAIAHLQLTVAFRDRVDLHLSLPVALYESGIAGGSGFPVQATNHVAVGDIRLGARLRLFHDAERDIFSLHAAGAVFIPAFESAQGGPTYLSDNLPRARVMLVAAGHAGVVRWSFGTGVHIRGEQVIDTSGSTVGSEWITTGAFGLVTSGDRLVIGPEFSLATTFDRAFRSGNVNAEVVLGAHYLAGDAVRIGFGAGPGLTSGIGTPFVRALLQLTYAPGSSPPNEAVVAPPPPPPDRDHDGVADATDVCPDVPGGTRPDRRLAGCPVGDEDHDGVLDPDDHCPAQPPGDHPDPTSAGCPLPDRDGDGVRDADDRCGDVPAGDHPDPTRPGCPDADTDGDGVTDHEDGCPQAPSGVLPDAQHPGCSLADRDHDLVTDERDRCPDVPGAPSANALRDGCPDAIVITPGAVLVRRPLAFTNARLRPDATPAIEALVNVLRAVPTVRLTIDVHAQGAPGDAYALVLAQDRADDVRRRLVAAGADGARIEAHGVAASGITGEPLVDVRVVPVR